MPILVIPPAKGPICAGSKRAHVIKLVDCGARGLLCARVANRPEEVTEDTPRIGCWFIVKRYGDPKAMLNVKYLVFRDGNNGCGMR